jgi:hypothetical protein
MLQSELEQRGGGALIGYAYKQWRFQSIPNVHPLIAHEKENAINGN